MNPNSQRWAKMIFFSCLLIMGALTYLNKDEPASPPQSLSGVVTTVQEQNGILQAFALTSGGREYVVRVPADQVMHKAMPKIEENQEIRITAKRFRAIKRGVVCDLVEIVELGPVRSKPLPEKGREPLPVDDLKPGLGYKGM